MGSAPNDEHGHEQLESHVASFDPGLKLFVAISAKCVCLFLFFYLRAQADDDDDAESRPFTLSPVDTPNTSRSPTSPLLLPPPPLHPPKTVQKTPPLSSANSTRSKSESAT
jgi:hypothetical protein